MTYLVPQHFTEVRTTHVIKKAFGILCALFVCNMASAQPVISSLSTGIGVPGSTVVISGSNFNSTPANDIVYFGATRATVNTASATSLSVTVPVGATYAPVTVTDIGTGMVAFSANAFLPDYDHSAYQPGTVNFDPKVNFADPANTGVFNTVIADIDGDGKPDLIVAGSVVSVYRNISASGSITSGSFAAPVDINIPDGGTKPAIAIGDIDGDGKPDLVIGYNNGNSIYVYRNTSASGSVNFLPPVSFLESMLYGSYTTPGVIIIMDVDGDGKADIVTEGINSFSVFRNISVAGVITTGSLDAPVNFVAVDGGFNGLAIGDLDGDGKPDLAFTTYNNNVFVYKNTCLAGSVVGGFADPVGFAVGNLPTAIVIADIDGDGKPDIAVINQNDNTLSLLQNTASTGSLDVSSFATQVVFATDQFPNSIASGDLDGDGKVDLAVTCGFSSLPVQCINLFHNTATPGAITVASLTGKKHFSGQNYQTCIAIGDLDGDSKADIITVNSTDNNISVLRNDPLLPVITSVSPVIAAPGTPITITGVSFNATGANDIVYFGATRAIVNSASATSLNVTVPVGATYAPITVNNLADGFTAYSPYPFLPDYNHSTYLPGGINFDPAVGFSVPGDGAVSCIVDIDGDGKPDIITAGSSVISVFLNTSASGSITSGSFAAPVSFTITGGPIYNPAFATGDIDGDGKPDVIIAGPAGIIVGGAPGSILVFRNTSATGAVSFASPVAYGDPEGAGITAIAVADMDGDGKADVVTASSSGYGNISVYMNSATPGSLTSASLATAIDFTTGTSVLSGMAIGDLDGDGKPDVAATDNTADVWVFRNTFSTGMVTPGFADPVSFATGNGAQGIVIADIDGDGKPDLAIANLYDATISVLQNTATIGSIDGSSFAGQVVFTTGASPECIATGDFDGDGKPDLAVSNFSGSGTQTISIFRNIAIPGPIDPGSLKGTQHYVGGSYQSLVVCDMDGDSKADIIISNADGSTFSILRNDPLQIPPAITSVSPGIGSPGATVTITGANFNTTASNDIVYFGATRATVNTASATSLSVTVPVGATYAPVSVHTANNSLTAFSAVPFLPDYNNSAYLPGTVNFDPRVTFAGHGTRTLAADIDGDGKTDLLLIGDVISVYLNTSVSGTISGGSFAAPVTIALPGAAGGMTAAGDIDGDGKPDLAVCDYYDNSVFIFHNTSVSGIVSFEAAVSFPGNAGDYPAAITIADVDGDGKADVVTAGGNYTVYQNTATAGVINAGSLAAGIDFPGIGAYCIAAGDLDGDGKPDLVTTDQGNNVWVAHNTSTPGTFSFEPPVNYTTGNHCWDVVIADIDGDGKQDLVVTNQNDNTISVLHNTATSGSIDAGSFAGQIIFPSCPHPWNIAVADFNGDGKADLVVTSAELQTISVFRNRAVPGTIDTGSLAIVANFTAGNQPINVAAADLDGDGKADIVTVNASDNTLSVLRNDPLYPPPTITSVSPGIDSPGASITIAGANFNTTAANDIVYFGATRATVNSASATSLSVIVPVGATHAPVTVNNTLHSLTAFSPYSFLPDYNNSAYIPGMINFDPQVTFTDPANSNINRTVIADIDGDGRADIVVAGIGGLSVYLNIGSIGPITGSSFEAPVIITMPGAPGFPMVAAGDIDGDGKPDLVFSDYIGNTIFAVHNTSHSGVVSFDAPVLFAESINDNPVAIAVRDIDGDGKADVLTISNVTNTLSVFQNTGIPGTITSSSLALPVDYTITSSYTQLAGMAVGDIDGDGKPDIAITDGNTNVWVLRNICTAGNINPGFAPAVSFATGNNPFGIVMGDIDGDGKPDLAITNANDNTISLLRNNSTTGTVSYAGQVVFAAGNFPYSIAVGDFDGDGKPDLTVGNLNDNTVSVFRNMAVPGGINAGSLAARLDLATGNEPISVAAGDIDGDSKADIVVVNANDNTVSVLRNDPITGSGITGATSLCIGGTTALSDSAAGGIWSSSATTIATVDNITGIVTGVAAGTATIIYTTGSIAATIVVTVNALPVAGSIAGPLSLPIGHSVALSDTVGGGIWSSSNTGVANINSAGIVTGIAGGSSVITYMVTNSCGSAYTSATVIVTTVTGSCATASNIATFAGDHVNGASGDGGMATAAETGSSYGVATDGAGNVYITDFYNNVVRKVSPTGIITTIAGTGAAGYNGDGMAATAAQLNGPMGVATDAAGNIYIADKYNERIRMINAAGVISTIAGNGFHGGTAGYGYGNGGPATAASLTYPVSVALDCSGNLYVADQGSETVRKIDPSGTINLFAGTYAGGYNGDGIAANAAQLNNPSGVATDCAGNVYIADAWNNRVRKVDATGVITTVAGNGASVYAGDGGPGTVASLWIPTGVTTDACGGLYICDWQNNAVRFLNADGIISTFAGNDIRGYDGDGSAANMAELYLPSSLAIDGAGNIYIADYGNYVVRAIGNTLPSERRFANGTTQDITICANADAVSLNNQMAIPDATAGITETWAVSVGPAHGTLSGFNATATSVAGITTPTGLIYTPVAGYTGIDAFTIVMNDGTTAASTTINVKVDSIPNAGVITGTANIAIGARTALADAAGDKNGVWSSSNNLVATVDAAGNVTGTGNGAVTISYTVSNGCGSMSATTEVTIRSAAQTEVALVPNPNDGTFMLRGKLGNAGAGNDEAVTLEVTDMLGQVVYKAKVALTNGSINETISLRNTLANGMYLLNVHSGTENKVFHFVVEK